MDLTVDDGKDPKRRRVNAVKLACTFCKKRHLKCDGQKPCEKCIERNQDCIYEANAKRGRKKMVIQNQVFNSEWAFSNLLLRT